jgi:integrase
MAKLTVLSVEKMRAGKTRQEIPDDYLPGLYLIVQPSNAKSWAVRYRHEGRTRKHTLGPLSRMDLAAAREAGRKALIAADAGRDPARQHKQDAVNTVAAAVEQFMQRHVRRNYRPKPLKEAERLLRLYVLDNWGDRKIADVTKNDLRHMLDKLVDDTPIAANRVHSIIRNFFNWCAAEDIIAVSPCHGLKAPAGKESSRDRTLTDDELRAVWGAAEQVGGIFGPMVQLLILTGQRRGEVAGMERGEIHTDTRVWSLPRERVKNNRRHDVPLSRQAIEIIGKPEHISDRYVFSLDGHKPINGFGKNRDRLHKLLPADMPEWVVHDLRRTVASGMARLGISLAVIEKVLNHVSGSFAGIVGVYQHHEFADEKRAALEKWADHVERIVSNKSGKVVSLVR